MTCYLRTRRTYLKSWLVTLLILVSILQIVSAGSAHAQDEQPSGAVYIVQSGDTLWDISLRFGVSMDELMSANNISDGSQIKEGDRLLIPGLENVEGILTTETIPLGETLSSLSRSVGVAPQILVRLNHLTSPHEIYAGMSLIIPQSEEVNPNGQRITMLNGQSLLEVAVLANTSPWTLAHANQLAGSWAVISGDVLRAPGQTSPGPGALPETISAMELNSMPFIQGQTGVITITASIEASFSGFLGDYPLHFFDDGNNNYIALQGMHAMQKAGLYPLQIIGTLSDGTSFGFTQKIEVQEGNFWQRPDPFSVDPKGLDSAINDPENELWSSIAQPATPIKYWQDQFAFPLPPLYLDEYSDYFGNRRKYNDDPKWYFHTGIDIPASEGIEVFAPAPGKIVFAGSLKVRGCVIVIDHGWGVYTGFMHLQGIRNPDDTYDCSSGILVKQGDEVETGQVIAYVGNTGLRTTGSHLHWEVIVGDVQVDPLDWLANQFP